jgi:SAM-dependent methyltransferase
MQAARQRGWQVEGLEIGLASARYARDPLGLTVHNVSLFDFETEPARFDAVALLEVIEHLESPILALRRIAGWLVPGGALVLSTPNFASLFRRVFGTRWWVINCEDEHIMFFDMDSLRRALRAAGFELVDQHIRGIDLAGMLDVALGRSSVPNPSGVDLSEHGYRAARSRKENLKTWLASAGLLHAARFAKSALEWQFSSRWSPLYGLGEQLVVIARKRTG